MATLGWFGTVWLSWFSQPAGDRSLFRLVRRERPRRILELGLGTLRRTERMLALVQAAGGDETHYVGLDRFEGRLPGDPPGVTLKEAHRRLVRFGRVQLVPGTADAALARLCNHLGTFDLVLVAAENDPRHLERSWFFLQRLATARTTVLVETPVAGRGGATAWKRIDKPRIDELAARSIQKRAA